MKNNDSVDIDKKKYIKGIYFHAEGRVLQSFHFCCLKTLNHQEFQMLPQFILLFISLTVSTAKTITGVFNSFDSLTWTRSVEYVYKGPETPTWNAVLGWSLNSTTADPGDTFNLILPCVFKFITTQTSVDLTADGVSYATCDFNAGEEFTTFSSLSCTVNSVSVSYARVSGTVKLPITFNVGGTGSSVDLADSKCFTAGKNTVTFMDGDTKISTTVDFDASPVSPSGYITSSRIIPSLNKLSSLFVVPQCENGYTSGIMGFVASNGATIDCSNINIGISKGLNDWNFPVSSESFSYTKTCTSTSITVEFQNVPAGYRPFVDAYISAENIDKYTLTYANEYTCENGNTVVDPFTLTWWGYKNSEADSDGDVIVVTTRTVTDSTTAVTTLPFNPSVDKTETIEILQPIPTTTITTSYIGISTSYETLTGTIGGTATVIVDTPYHITATVTNFWTGSITTTTTYTNPTGSIDTVIVQIPLPDPTTTITEFWSESFASTTTVTNPPDGTNSVIIKEPYNPTVTTTEFWSESFASTTTITNPPDGTNSVIVKEPHNPTVTTTEFWSESFASTTTVTNPPDGTNSVIIKEPYNPTVTTTEFWSESFASTTPSVSSFESTIFHSSEPHYSSDFDSSDSFVTLISVTTASSYDESSTIVSSTFPTLHLSSYTWSSGLVPPVTFPRYVNTTISNLPTFESSSVYSSTASAVASTDGDSVVPSSTNLVTQSSSSSETYCIDISGCSSVRQSSSVMVTPSNSGRIIISDSAYLTTTYLHSELDLESIVTVVQTKSSDWSLSSGNSHKPESATTVSDDNSYSLSTPGPSSSEYSILFTSEKEGHVSSYVPRVSYTSSVKVSISSTMSSENGMSATHTFGISTNTIPSSTETSIKSATVTTPVSESTNTGMSIFMSTTTESKTTDITTETSVSGEVNLGSATVKVSSSEFISKGTVTRIMPTELTNSESTFTASPSFVLTSTESSVIETPATIEMSSRSSSYSVPLSKLRSEGETTRVIPTSSTATGSTVIGSPSSVSTSNESIITGSSSFVSTTAESIATKTIVSETPVTKVLSSKSLAANASPSEPTSKKETAETISTRSIVTESIVAGSPSLVLTTTVLDTTETTITETSIVGELSSRSLTFKASSLSKGEITGTVTPEMSVSTSKATTGTTSEVSIKESLTTKVPTFTSTTIKPETSETQHSESRTTQIPYSETKGSQLSTANSQVSQTGSSKSLIFESAISKDESTFVSATVKSITTPAVTQYQTSLPNPAVSVSEESGKKLSIIESQTENSATQHSIYFDSIETLTLSNTLANTLVSGAMKNSETTSELTTSDKAIGFSTTTETSIPGATNSALSPSVDSGKSSMLGWSGGIVSTVSTSTRLEDSTATLSSITAANQGSLNPSTVSKYPHGSETIDNGSNGSSHSSSALASTISASHSITFSAHQTTLSQLLISSSTKTVIASTYDGSGSVIKLHSWFYGLVTIFFLFI